MATNSTWVALLTNATAMLSLGGIFLIFAVISAGHSVALGIPSALNLSTDDAISATGSFATVAAIFFGLYQFRHQDEIQRSHFALTMAREGVERAYQVLSNDKPTRRMAWINAARLLLRVEETARNITEPDHLASWGLHKDEWRIKLLHFLRCGHRYYFGLGALEECELSVSIDQNELQDCFRSSTVSEQFQMPGLSWEGDSHTNIPERVTRVIFEFASSLKNWQDPLAKREGFTESEIENLGERSLYGVLAYVTAMRTQQGE